MAWGSPHNLYDMIWDGGAIYPSQNQRQQKFRYSMAIKLKLALGRDWLGLKPQIKQSNILYS